MALTEYRARRHFPRTPEPPGEPAPQSAGPLRFVVQKHAARSLHYDFRLELDGVLKSWAVPKGPSRVPGEKRLAVETEDHPLEYASFEGVIPQGEYGAGRVVIWDRGVWFPVGDPHEGLRKGNLELRLEGEKLRGRWRLIRLKPKSARDKPSWLLLKVKDKPGEEAAAVPGALPGARKASLPARPQAELATLVGAPPEGPEWIHELKLDGYRILCRIDRGKVQLWTRNGHDWTDTFPTIAEAAATLPCRNAILDGEAVVLDAEGKSNFQALQGALKTRRKDIRYVAFDLLHLDGYDVMPAPLVARKDALRRLVVPTDGVLRYSDHVEGRGRAFFDAACGMGVEGIVSKQRDAPYTPGRTKTWVKVKCVMRQELVVVGFTEPKRSRKGIGALLLGVYGDDGKLRYAGKVGTGFATAELPKLRAKLERLARKQPTAQDPPRAVLREAHWVAPELVAEVRFTEWTRDGHVRHPVFEGLREDKDPSEVRRERPASPPAARRGRAAGVEVAGIRLTNPDKVLFPEQGITKREVAEYYQAIADRILPWLEHRPLTLLRCPEGRAHKCFYQKHGGVTVPEVVPRVDVKKGEAPYLMVDGLGSLIALVQLGVLEFHVWGARAERLDEPDQLVFDLDPDPSVGWPRVVETARALRERLESLGLAAYPRLTGGKGLHLFVPLTPRVGWAEAKAFTHEVAKELVRVAPRALTVNMAKRARVGKIFIDYLRNARDATAVVSYSTRAREGAPVAVPLGWEELDDKSAVPPRFELRQASEWLTRIADPWRDLDAARRPLTREILRAVGVG